MAPIDLILRKEVMPALCDARQQLPVILAQAQNSQDTHACRDERAQLLLLADRRIPDNHPRQHRQDNINKTRVRRHKDVVVNDHMSRPARTLSMGFPQPLGRPALGEVDGGAGAEDKVDRDDDNPEEQLDARLGGGDDA